MQSFVLPVTRSEQAFVAPNQVAFQFGQSTYQACLNAAKAIAQFGFAEVVVGEVPHVDYDCGTFNKHHIVIRPGNVCFLRSETDCGCEYVETDIAAVVFN